MKRVSPYSTLIAIGIVAVVAWVPPASAYENEPTGFGGLEWGTPVPDDMTFVREDPVTWDQIYTRSSDSLRFGDAPTRAVYYAFNFAGEFYKAEIYATGEDDNTAFYTYLKNKYGDADELSGDGPENQSLWKGQTTTIYLTHDATEFPSETYIVYVGTGVVESTKEMLDSAMDFLEGTTEEGDEEEEDPFEGLFD